jgi:uncharacterized protein (TIGR00369 family)
VRTQAELEELLDQRSREWRKFVSITNLGESAITLKMPFRDDFTRQGGTISGPALMALADRAAYYLILVRGGALESVTSNLDIHFLARPQGDVDATATMLRHGRRLAVSRVEMFVGSDLVAHSTVTYALPR